MGTNKEEVKQAKEKVKKIAKELKEQWKKDKKQDKKTKAEYEEAIVEFEEIEEASAEVSNANSQRNFNGFHKQSLLNKLTEATKRKITDTLDAIKGTANTKSMVKAMQIDIKSVPAIQQKVDEVKRKFLIQKCLLLLS